MDRLENEVVREYQNHMKQYDLEYETNTSSDLGPEPKKSDNCFCHTFGLGPQIWDPPNQILLVFLIIFVLVLFSYFCISLV
jgi:hypothetical protein